MMLPLDAFVDADDFRLYAPQRKQRSAQRANADAYAAKVRAASAVDVTPLPLPFDAIPTRYSMRAGAHDS